MDEIHHLAVEDLEIWEHKAYLARPRLADTDGPIMAFRRWAAQFYDSDSFEASPEHLQHAVV